MKSATKNTTPMTVTIASTPPMMTAVSDDEPNTGSVSGKSTYVVHTRFSMNHPIFTLMGYKYYPDPPPLQYPGSAPACSPAVLWATSSLYGPVSALLTAATEMMYSVNGVSPERVACSFDTI